MTTQAQAPDKSSKAYLLQSREAEQSLIGSLLLDNLAWDRISQAVLAEDFFYTEHQLIFDAISYLQRQNKAVDTLTVTDILQSRDQIKAIGGEAYLYEIVNQTPSAANIQAYPDIVKDRSCRVS